MILNIAKVIKRAGRDKRGFTLVELMAVLAVLAIIAAIAVPRFTGTIKAAKVQADEASALIIARAAEQKWIDDGSKTSIDGYKASDLADDGYLKETPAVQNPDVSASDYYAELDDEGKCIKVYYGTDASGTVVKSF